MTESNIQLKERLVGEIKGKFYVPSYQRGYRWDETQVKALLDDIYENGDKPYCLQPLVVRENGQDMYEVIDGQQRLTTLYIIYQYIKNRWPNDNDAPKFSLVYETRKANQEFFHFLPSAAWSDEHSQSPAFRSHAHPTRAGCCHPVSTGCSSSITSPQSVTPCRSQYSLDASNSFNVIGFMRKRR